MKLPSYVWYLIITILAFATWKASSHFFWRDEWHFLWVMMDLEASWFFKPFMGHVKPIFKFAYWLEVQLFGTNSLLYHYANVAALGLVGFLFMRMGRALQLPHMLTLAGTAIMVMHPINFATIMWSFQISIWIQLAGQIGFVLLMYRYVTQGSSRDFGLAMLCLIMQNYAFGNGIFMPLVGVLLAVVYLPRKRLLQTTAILGTLQLLFLVIQHQVMQGSGGATSIGGILSNFDQVLSFGLKYIGGNVNRFFFVSDALGSAWFGLGILGGFVAYAIYTYKSTGKLMLVLFGWFLLTSITVPMARYYMPVIHYYYTTFAFVPMLAMFLLAFHRASLDVPIPKWAPVISKVAMTSLLVVYFIADQRLITIFSSRDSRNQVNMIEAIKSDRVYEPFDDPVIDMDLLRDVNDEPSGVTAKKAYEYWQRKTKFHINRYEN
jgi:hypothetical protein